MTPSHPAPEGPNDNDRLGRRLVVRLATALAVAATCLSIVPALASAADPANGTRFDFEGCRLPAGQTLPQPLTYPGSTGFVCADGDYTNGNLGKNYAELDLVPFRLSTDSKVQQTYTIAVAADRLDAGKNGYDVISVPVVNTALSVGTCSVSAGPQSLLTPGQGGTDTSIYRLLTITQSAGSQCVFDYYKRLALGSAAFPGSSLHANLLNEQLTTAGIGSREISIPVNRAQGLSKTMTATTGNSSVWNVTKDSSPVNLSFDSCNGAAARSQGATITVNWTKTATVAGVVTLVSNITIANPAARSIVATVQDKMYQGLTQVTQAGATYNSPPTTVPANSTVTLTNTQVAPVVAGVTQYNDVATAAYTDPVTLVPIPGQTTASASANLVTNNVPNDNATISDTEQITGNGLSFSIESVSTPGGTFSPAYTPGSGVLITGPITWTKAVTGSGTAVFQKTVHVAGPLNTTGLLSDTATVVDSLPASPDATASASTTITSRACIQGQKFDDVNGNGVRDAGEPGLGGVRIYVDLNGDSAFTLGEPSAVTDASGNYSISTAAIPDGTYALREVAPTGSVCSFPSPCSYSITVGPGGPLTGRDFGNHVPAPVVAGSSGTPVAPVAPPKTGLQGSGTVQPRVPGTAALHGPRRCVSRSFTASVRGRAIVRVQFYVDNRLVATRTKRNAAGTFAYTVDPRTQSYAAHRLTARVTFTAASGTAARRLGFTFMRCAKAVAPPVFTG